MDLTGVLAIAGLFAIAAVLALISWQVDLHRRGKRRSEVTAQAAAVGWALRPAEDPDPSLARRFTRNPFGRGHEQQVHNVAYGDYRGRPLVAFDLSFEEPGGEGEGTERWSYAVLAVHVGPVRDAQAIGILTAELDRQAAAWPGLDADLDGESLLLTRGGKGRRGRREAHWAAHRDDAFRLLDGVFARLPEPLTE